MLWPKMRAVQPFGAGSVEVETAACRRLPVDVVFQVVFGVLDGRLRDRPIDRGARHLDPTDHIGVDGRPVRPVDIRRTDVAHTSLLERNTGDDAVFAVVCRQRGEDRRRQRADGEGAHRTTSVPSSRVAAARPSGEPPSLAVPERLDQPSPPMPDDPASPTISCDPRLAWSTPPLRRSEHGDYPANRRRRHAAAPAQAVASAMKAAAAKLGGSSAPVRPYKDPSALSAMVTVCAAPVGSTVKATASAPR